MDTYDIELPAEFRSGNSIPVERATITRERMTEILQDAIAADRQQRGEPVVRQYYYQTVGCKADGADAPDCICWHDKGTGPFPDLKEGEVFGDVQVSWRVKPATPVREPSDEEIIELAEYWCDDPEAGGLMFAKHRDLIGFAHALLARYGIGE